MNNTESFGQSLKLVPGGVHSPVRSFKGLKSTPVFMSKGNGAYLYDVEGKKYIDFCMSFGPLVLGHRDEVVYSSLTEALNKGWSFGTCEPYSLKLAEFITSKIDFIDQVRFVNSGTEAVMTALRLARGYTNRSKIIKFDGCYHGHTDSMLIKAGSGLAGTAEASSGGVPEGISKDTIIFELNDIESVSNYMSKFGNEVAAIIVEPLPANNGLLIQSEEYLRALRKLTEESGSLLIFDEVISGFRINGIGGMSMKYDFRPDIVTYGKVIGGGLPVGAIGSSKKIMETLAPTGPVYQAGTLSANPLAMVGGLATLSQLDESVYKKINEFSKEIIGIFTEYFRGHEKEEVRNLEIISKDSLFWITPKIDIHRASEIPGNFADGFNIIFEEFLEKGIYLSPNAYEVGFVSVAHDQDVINDLKERLWSK